MNAVADMAKFAHRLSQTPLAARSPLIGCNGEEIAALERKYQLTLPGSYREFLTQMGHCAAGLGSDPDELLYPAVFRHTANERADCERVNQGIDAAVQNLKFSRWTSNLLRRVGLPASEVDLPHEAGYFIPEDLLIIYCDDLPSFWAIK